MNQGSMKVASYSRRTVPRVAFRRIFWPPPWNHGGLKQVEIVLGDLGKAEDAVHGAKAGANGEVAGVLLVHPNDEVLAVGDIGRLGLGIHVLEELSSLEALLAQLHLHHVELFAWGNGQFTANAPGPWFWCFP